ncbi:hypothetical protein [uncultured Bartonella sp.]|nr:hypothetical protein [uncultured Bartonella sp.]
MVPLLNSSVTDGDGHDDNARSAIMARVNNGAVKNMLAFAAIGSFYST